MKYLVALALLLPMAAYAQPLNQTQIDSVLGSAVRALTMLADRLAQDEAIIQKLTAQQQEEHKPPPAKPTPEAKLPPEPRVVPKAP
jgi:hypothetical protein